MTVKDNLRRIAEELLILSEQNSEEQSDLRSDSIKTQRCSLDPRYITRFAQSLYNSRRIRMHHFDGSLFGEPSWDMLLDLFVQQSSGLQVSVKSLCLASDVPDTTALRWIALLVETGLVARKDDERDRRRTFLSLTPSGEAAIRRCLIEIIGLTRASAVPSFMLVEPRI